MAISNPPSSPSTQKEKTNPLPRHPHKPRFLFIIKGALTIIFGLIGLRFCVDFPERWSSRLFREDEMRFLQLRVKYQDGPVAPDDEFKGGCLWEAMRDWKTYCVCPILMFKGVFGFRFAFGSLLICWGSCIASLLAFGGTIPTNSVNYTLATMVKSLGYTSIKAQALTAPPYVFAFFCVIEIAMYSDKFLANEAPTYRTGFILILVFVMIGGVGVTILNWLCLRAATLEKDRLLPEDLEGEYTEQQLSEMGTFCKFLLVLLLSHGVSWKDLEDCRR
ncbi:hypothetical protein HYALB_00011058 [Hymenoscyphus albidus]|uniref:Uncharacterized protein n=1 Tax=Hymenoscyphus albidus TaxID=595503 RepID=A0A9N9PXS9_9HELO|nr:hypothetical protein HYALB_00011058 [Hymenoscyphus albidus]